ncbi:MAG: pyruvate kinase [Holosporales bacterium]|jgi:pyruvate kinase|nr:pyruvate kinase [Holosporales bacterium]
MNRVRKTKIIATLGPASSSEVMIRRLAVAGVNVFRLNFSHGTHDVHKQTAESIRKIEKELCKTLGIMMDLQGPKIRIGIFDEGRIVLSRGAKFVLDLKNEPGNSKRVYLPHPELFKALQPDTDLLLDDGKIRLVVQANDGDLLTTEVVEGGMLSNKKGVNIPNVVLPIPILTAKDKVDVKLVEDIDADFVAISFVQTASDITYARKFVRAGVKIVAKIEKPSAVEHIDAILDKVDIVMIARGDLGVEMPYEAIPGIQKTVINKALRHQKPVIVATQMLESMRSCCTPTRAEVSDVSCAVAEGADAVMLSAESASGDYPEEAVLAMDRIIRQTECDKISFMESTEETMTAMASAVSCSVIKENVELVAVFTETGKSAELISNGRPRAMIVALSPNRKTARQQCLTWGVLSISVDEVFNFSQMVQFAKKAICENFEVESDIKIIIVAGIPFMESGPANLLHICKIAIPVKQNSNSD